MIILYFLLILVIALLIWMALRKKWKTLLWTVACLLIVAIAGVAIFLHIVSEAFGETCDDNRVWKIENYVIVEKRCIGFAGPYYYPIYLYKNHKEIDHLLYKNDSTCVLQFQAKTGETLTFDICEMKLKSREN